MCQGLPCILPVSVSSKGLPGRAQGKYLGGFPQGKASEAQLITKFEHIIVHMAMVVGLANMT